jgi:hypothetical protein
MRLSNYKECIIYRHDWFGDGSRIVIRQVLKGGDGAEIYVFGDSG